MRRNQEAAQEEVVSGTNMQPSQVGKEAFGQRGRFTSSSTGIRRPAVISGEI